MPRRFLSRFGRFCACAIAVALGACGSKPVAVAGLDFGAVPWGQLVSKDVVVGVDGFEGPLHVLDFRSDCSCVTAELFARASGGALRPLADVPFAQRRLAAGEVPLLRVWIDASDKLVADEAVALHEAALLASVGDGDAVRDVELPVSLRFGIESSLRLLPAPQFEFGDVRKGGERTLRIQFLAKDATKSLAFGEPRSDEPRVRCSLQHGADAAELVATISVAQGDGVGLIAGRIEVPMGTGVAPLRVPFSARVVAGLEASLSNVSFGAFDAASERPEREFTVVDHDSDAAPDLQVLRFTDTNGADIADRIDVTITVDAARSREAKVHLAWKADARRGPVRGDLTLSKKGQDETFLQVGISAFPRSDSAGAR
jgi:hypothetical protein